MTISASDGPRQEAGVASCPLNSGFTYGFQSALAFARNALTEVHRQRRNPPRESGFTGIVMADIAPKFCAVTKDANHLSFVRSYSSTAALSFSGVGLRRGHHVSSHYRSTLRRQF